MFSYMKKYRSILSTLFLILLIMLSLREAYAQPQKSQGSESSNSQAENVIAHPGIHNTELSLNELRSIFSLRARQWPDGTSITVFVLRDEQEVHRQFLLKTLKMLPHQLRRQWDRYIYSGIGQGPVVVESQEEMLNKVKSTPGGIGYIEGGVPDDQVLMLSIR
jgi:ABC-type phosphate transport system substrate-binding protein